MSATKHPARFGVNVLDFGADSTGVSDSATAIQSAITAVSTTGGNVYIPQGAYKCLSGLTIPTSKPVHLIGEGMAQGGGATTLSFPADLGAGNYAINSSVHVDGSGRPTIRDLSIVGPTSYTQASGTAPCNMDGLYHARNLSLYRVAIRNFRAGAVIDGDHNRMRDCHIFGCFYDIYFPSNEIANADQSFTGCIFDQAFANVGVGGSGNVESTMFSSCHFANAAMCFYREAFTASGGPFITDTLFDRCSFEAWGNAMFYDESYVASAAATDYITKTTFNQCWNGGGFNSSNKVAAKNSSASWYIYGGSAITVNGSLPAQLGTTSAIRAGIFWNNDLGEVGTLVTAAQSAALPVFTIGGNESIGNLCHVNQVNNDALRTECRVVRANNAVSQWDLVEADGEQEKVRKSLGTRPPCGVAQHGLSAAGNIVMAVDGSTPINSGATVVAAFAYLKPDTVNNGQITTASSATDLPIVGYATRGNASNTVYTRLRLSY